MRIGLSWVLSAMLLMLSACGPAPSHTLETSSGYSTSGLQVSTLKMTQGSLEVQVTRDSARQGFTLQILGYDGTVVHPSTWIPLAGSSDLGVILDQLFSGDLELKPTGVCSAQAVLVLQGGTSLTLSCPEAPGASLNPFSQLLQLGFSLVVVPL